ncbi:hypothetical protein GYA49_00665 [Candidatus Beckwithbacteria bacterium]|nr:hypothetical protein [Candidatus Beckwithbacteria bacterium]
MALKKSFPHQSYIDFKFDFKKNRWLLILLATWGVFFLTFWPKMLYVDSDGNLTTGWWIVWADWAMHISQVMNLYSRPLGAVLANNPLFYGQKLAYPLFTNLLSANLLKVGFTLPQAMVLPSIAFSFSLLLGLYTLGKMLVKHEAQIFLAICVFFTGGSLGFIEFLKDPSLSENIRYANTHIPDLGYWMYNVFLGFLIPQRAMLAGMGLGIWVFCFVIWLYLKDFKVKNLTLFLAGLVTGLLTYVHVHTVIVLFFLCFWLLLMSYRYWYKWLLFGAGAFLTALPFFLWGFDRDLGTFMRLQLGWLAHNNGTLWAWFLFWFKNWGVFLPVVAIGFWQIWKKTKLRNIYLAFLLIFGLANIWLFQPYDWDNAKLFIWVYLFWCFLAVQALSFVWQKKIAGKLLATILCIFLILAGTLDLFRLLQFNEQPMLTSHEIDLAQMLRRKSSHNDIILNSDWHLQWASVLTGRQIMMGYRGWLWSWGIDYNSRLEEVRKIYQGEPQALDLIKKYSIDWIILDSSSRGMFENNEQFLDEHFIIDYEEPGLKIYKVK